MKALWDDNTDEPKGATMNEEEHQLLLRLAGALTQYELVRKGFTAEERTVIQNWYYQY